MDLTFNDGGIVLNSWKEIASHVGRGVRTVQRWERDLGMPVRRPRAKSRSAVIAMSDEIDAWLRSAPTGELTGRSDSKTSEAVAFLHREMASHAELRNRCFELRIQNHEIVARLVENIKLLHDSINESKLRRGTTPRIASLEEVLTVKPHACE